MTPIDDRILQGLGRITVEFQSLESVFRFLIQIIVDPKDPAIGQIITSQLSFQRLCDISLALFRHRVLDNKLIDELENLVKQAMTVEQKRNTYIHSLWAIRANDEGKFPVGRLKTKLKKRELTFDSEEIDPTGDVLNNLGKEMSQIVSNIVKLMINARSQGLIDFPYVVRDQVPSSDSA